jgi:hypothetical protein
MFPFISFLSLGWLAWGQTPVPQPPPIEHQECPDPNAVFERLSKAAKALLPVPSRDYAGIDRVDLVPDDHFSDRIDVRSRTGLVYSDGRVDGYAIYFTAGILKKMRSVDELAIVMGHELAHIRLGHLDQRRRDRLEAYWKGKVDAAQKSDSSRDAAASAQDHAGWETSLSQTEGLSPKEKAWLAEFNRGIEDEADRYGVEIALKAGYDPAAGAGIHLRMAREEPLEELKSKDPLSDYPTHADRYARIEEEIVPLQAYRVEHPESPWGSCQ